MEQLSLQSLEDFRIWSQNNHKVGRNFNSDLITKNFHYTNNPYSPHIITLKDGNMYAISSQDGTVSIIDAKTSKMSNIKSADIISILWWDSSLQANDLAKKIQDLQSSLIFEQQKEYLSQKIYPKLKNPYQNNTSKEQKLTRYKTIKNITKLYNETYIYSKNFWEKNEENMIDLTEHGRAYFSQTILRDFLEYNEKTNFLGRDWLENLFPHNLFLWLRSKLAKGELLSLDEIGEFITYLLEKEEEQEWESKSKMRERHHRNQLKSHVINMLYAIMYTEQRYNYVEISQYTQWFSTSLAQGDNNMSKKLTINHEDIYTEWGIKWLPSMSFKELRWEDVKDYMRWRTWIDRSILEDNDKKHQFIEETFTQHIQNIKDYFQKEWFYICFHNFEIANKFQWDDISFNKEKLLLSENTIKKIFEIITKEEDKTHLRNYYSYNIQDLSYPFFDQRTKHYVQYAMNKDNSKTWWNGNYADVKCRLSFDLISQENPHHKITNLSYEHMIVNMDSHNEWWLSDHNIFLDPLKTIQSKLKISTAIATDIFVDSVSWGIDKTIRELTTLQSYKNNPTTKPSNISMKFVEQQLTIRNAVPQEILDIAWIREPLTYLQVDTHQIYKEKIELAVATYLLRDQCNKGRLHWFIYDNDNIPNLSDQLQGKIKNWKELSYYHKWQEKLIQDALKNRHTWKYCLCGWGSNNLAKATNSKLHSYKGYIGIVIPWTDEIMFIGISDFSWMVNLGTNIKNKNIVIWSLTDALKKILQ